MALLQVVNPSTRPSKRRRRRARNPASNPKRRRRRSARRGYATNPRRRRRRNALRTYHHRKKRRRNPLGVRGGDVMQSVMAAILAAVGSVGLDVAWGNLPIPAELKAGNLQFVVKGLGAVALGAGAHKMGASRRTAELFTLGALAVMFAGAGRNLMRQYFPSISLGYYSPGYIVTDNNGNMGQYMSAYMSQDANTSFPIGGRSPCPALPAPRGASAMRGFESDPAEIIDDQFGSDY